MSASDKSWIKSCPTSDGNIKPHLKAATDVELYEVISELPEQGNKTKIKAIKAELKRRNK